MISCRGEQRKQKRGPFPRKEKDLQRLQPPLLLPIAVCYESGKPGILNSWDLSKSKRAIRASASASPLFLPGQDRWKGALSSQGHNQPSNLCTYTFVSQGGAYFLKLVFFQNKVAVGAMKLFLLEKGKGLAQSCSLSRFREAKGA